jgi:hypothetical protein
MSDRLALAHAIEEAGIPREKAENVATAIARFIEGSSATKADVERTEAALRTDIARVETNLKLEIASVRTEITKLDAKVEQIGSRAFNRLGALVAAGVAVIVALQHFWPPH